MQAKIKLELKVKNYWKFLVSLSLWNETGQFLVEDRSRKNKTDLKKYKFINTIAKVLTLKCVLPPNPVYHKYCVSLNTILWNVLNPRLSLTFTPRLSSKHAF